MSERTYASRSGGRGRGDQGRRDAETRESGARGARRLAEQDDTRRSGIRRSQSGGRGRRAPEAPVAGATALKLDVSVDPARKGEPSGAPLLRVAPPLPVRAPRATFVAGVIALVLVGVLGILLINTKTMEQSFRLAELEKGAAELDKQEQELDQQLNAARKPGNLRAAFKRLGLVPADPDSLAMIRLPDGEIIRTPTAVEGVPSVTAQDPLPGGDKPGEKTADKATDKVDGESATGGAGQ